MTSTEAVTPDGLRQARDLVVWFDGATAYVVACDANASIGQLPHDFHQSPPEQAGYNAAKVPLMEVLAAGAEPFLVVNTLCGPLDDYGQRVVTGIKAALDDIGSHALVTGSDETNMKTSQSGVGVTVLGHVERRGLRIGASRAGDAVVCVGRPKDGVRVPYSEEDVDVATPSDVLAILDVGVHEVLPVGSKGVGYELHQLATTSGHGVRFEPSDDLDLAASAGASTCFLASLPPSRLDSLRASTSLPVAVVGYLTSQ